MASKKKQKLTFKYFFKKTLQSVLKHNLVYILSLYNLISW